MKDLIRVLILEEAIENLEDPETKDKIVLEEYLQFVDENGKKVLSPTNSNIPMYQLSEILRTAKPNLRNAAYRNVEKTNTSIYQFAFRKNSGIISNQLGQIEQLAVIIPGNIKAKHQTDPAFDAFQDMLAIHTLKPKKKLQKSKLQKQNKYVGNISLALLTAASIGCLGYSIHSGSVKLEELRKQRELQELYQQHQLQQLENVNTEEPIDEWSLRLQQEREEENQRTRGL